MQDFVHLHVHTEYSILDGQSNIFRLVDKALGNGMRGMAVTDHGCMMGIKTFYNYVGKKKGKAKDALKSLKDIRQRIDEGTYQPDPDDKEQVWDIGKSREQLLSEYERKMEKQQRILDFKPILGCEMYVARHRMTDKIKRDDASGWHLVVLAKNEKGYHNLIKLVSDAWTDGFYFKPRTDHEQLAKYHEGLIVSSACLAGEVPGAILNDNMEAARKSIQWFKSIFGDDFYLELQRHEVKKPEQRANRETFPLQQKVNKALASLSHECGVKLICTNDCHFVDEEDAEAHDRLICLSTNKEVDDESRMLYSKQEWFKTREEMNAVFADFPDALANTCEICDKVECYSIDHGPIMPNFAIPEDFGTEEAYRRKYTEKDLFDEFTRDENGNVVCSEEEAQKKISKLGGYDKLYRIKLEADYLGCLTYQGAKKRYGEPLAPEVNDRLRFELHVMKTMGFPGYFLIVQDYINAARNELGVSVGPGRGSAAGSAVAYCLGITQVDPIKYDLLFERFLNPDRISLPDIDVDFDDDGRGRVLDWVTKKYGEDKVAHIITFSTLATKSVVSSVARVERLPLSKSQQLVKAIPDKLPDGPDGKPLKMNLTNVIACVPLLQEAEQSPEKELSETIRYARMLEGCVRGTGVHACGTIICRDPISDWVPVSTADDKKTGEKFRCTQYEGSVIEETGLIKMDFLGLKNLSIIRDALTNIEESLGMKLDIDNIDINDPATYQLFSDGRTIGVFQFESPGMQKYLRELQPTTFEDLIAMNALYRPGPLAYIPQFIKRKHGEEEIKYDLPCMEKYLKETYGITVYQEQVMLLSREIAGFTRGESDTLRKAMGKKLIEKLNHLHPKFLAGGKAHGYEEHILNKIWDDWRAFASYAFNKSHATCYSWVAYQTAYLKANFPSQYMAATMSRSLNNIEDITKLMDECKLMGIATLSPDVNESRIFFSVNVGNNIRFGLGAIKGIGNAAAEAIVQERDRHGLFKNVFDFVERMDLAVCNRRVLESLVLSGAFDGFDTIRREQYFESNNKGENFIELLLRYGQTYQQDKASNENSLFGEMEEFEISKPIIPPVGEIWSDLNKLNKERELIGIYLSAHPLDEYKIILSALHTISMEQIGDVSGFSINQELTFGGIVVDVKEMISKKGKNFGVVRMEDYNGQGELRLFDNDWPQFKNFFAQGTALLLKGRIVAGPRWNPAPMFKLEGVRYLADEKDVAIKSLTLVIPNEKLDDNACGIITEAVNKNKGKTDLYFLIKSADGKTQLRFKSNGKGVNVCRGLLDMLKTCEGLEYEL